MACAGRDSKNRNVYYFDPPAQEQVASAEDSTDPVLKEVLSQDRNRPQPWIAEVKDYKDSLPEDLDQVGSCLLLTRCWLWWACAARQADEWASWVHCPRTWSLCVFVCNRKSVAWSSSDCACHPVRGCEESAVPEHLCVMTSGRGPCRLEVVRVQTLLKTEGKAARPEELDPVTGCCRVDVGLHAFMCLLDRTCCCRCQAGAAEGDPCLCPPGLLSGSLKTLLAPSPMWLQQARQNST